MPRLLEHVAAFREKFGNKRILPHRETVIVSNGCSIVVGVMNDRQHALGYGAKSEACQSDLAGNAHAKPRQAYGVRFAKLPR